LLGAVLAPALARALAGRRGSATRPVPPGPGLLLLAPLACATLGGAIFVAVWRTPAPARAPVLVPPAFWAPLPAFFVPALVAGASALRIRVRWRWAALIALAVCGGAAAALFKLTWTDDLRFAPWTDIIVGAAVIAGALALIVALGPRLPRRRGTMA